MTRMLTSFFYSALPEMATWREPNEGAFMLPLPKGWSVQGGIRRFHALDLRAEVVVASPDGKIVIRLGDVSEPSMEVPDQFVQAQGLREGGWYNAGAGLQVLLRRYMPAPEFLLEYVQAQVGPATNVRYRDYPDISRQAEQNLAQATLGMVRPRVDASETTFDLPTQNGPRKGYALAQTQLMPIESILAPDMGMWLVAFLAGYVSVPEREPIAVAVLREMLAGQAVDPAWYANELRLQGQVSAIIHRTNSEINDMAWESYQAKFASEERIAQSRTEAILGLTVVHDPSTNKQYRVTAGSNYY